MLSQEIKGLSGVARQFRALFVGLDKLADAVDELDRRDAALTEREGKAEALDDDIKAKQSQLDNVTKIVAEKMKTEENRQRTELDIRLTGLRTQVATDERRAATAKAQADKEENRLRNLQDSIGKLGLAPAGQ